MYALSNLIQHRHPPEQPRSLLYALCIDGEAVDVLDGDKADFAVFECTGPVDLEVIGNQPMDEALVKPLAQNISIQIQGRCLRFTIEKPCYLCIDVPGSKPLFIYANAPEAEKPSRSDPDVLFFGDGKIHQVGRLELKSGDTLYIEAGAVVQAHIVCSGATKVKIRGQGILDGSIALSHDEKPIRSIIFDHCRDVSIEDIIMIKPSSWMVVLGCCQNVRVRHLKQIGSCMSSDGIDICGSQDVLIENCCLRNEDDNIAIKSVKFPGSYNWRGNVENVLVRGCLFLNGQPGNVMEIGYELSADHVRAIVFQDIDVINAHGEGAVFSIHNGDRATVEDVRWENIRVEHYWDKLIDFRVVKSRYNSDTQRGLIRNIHLKNIRVLNSRFNPGCSISLISGHTADEPAENIILEDFFLGDLKVSTPDELDLYTRNTQGVRFC